MLQSVLFRITCTRTFVLRAGRVEVIADSESQTAVVCSLIQVELMDIAEDGDLLAHGGKDIVNGQLHQISLGRLTALLKRTMRIGSFIFLVSPKYFTSKSCHIMASINWG